MKKENLNLILMVAFNFFLCELAQAKEEPERPLENSSDDGGIAPGSIAENANLAIDTVTD